MTTQEIAKPVSPAEWAQGVEFLQTLQEKDFCRWMQTKDFDPDNIGVCHCVLGHLFVNPKSPLYGRLGFHPSLHGGNRVTTDNLRDRADFDLIDSIVNANNLAPTYAIKEASINTIKRIAL